LENTHGTLVFERMLTDTESEDQTGAAPWTLVGLTADEVLSADNVNMLVGQVCSMTMAEPLGKSEAERYGMDSPNAVVTLETAEETITLRVGAQDPDGGYYVVKASNSPYFVHVAATAVDRLVESSRDSFLQVPPTPATQESDPGS
jgi:hypothetical protein